MNDDGGAVFDAAPRSDGAVPDAASDAGADSGASPDAGVRAVFCGGIACESGEECCLSSGRCFNPSMSASCPSDPEGCVSNAGCAAEEYCAVESGCLGIGECRPLPSLDDCGPGSPVCGCDGVTYGSRCHAGRAGVQISAGEGACGTVDPDGGPRPCGRDSDCDSGGTCCDLTGLCVPPDCPDCCASAPTGTLYPCRSDRHCANGMYCDGPLGTCGELGGCRNAGGSCGGELEPVCGCDGVTYTNPCFAKRAMARLESEGACGED